MGLIDDLRELREHIAYLQQEEVDDPEAVTTELACEEKYLRALDDAIRLAEEAGDLLGPVDHAVHTPPTAEDRYQAHKALLEDTAAVVVQDDLEIRLEPAPCPSCKGESPNGCNYCNGGL